MAVEPGVITPMLYVPSPVMYGVTSRDVHWPPVTAPELDMLLPMGGMLS